MANAAAAIGVSFDSTDLQDATIGVFLELVDGGPYQTAEVRGEDLTIPSRAGQDPLARIAHQRRITLRGWVAGVGADEQAQRASFESQALALAALFDPTAVGEMLATLPSGATATIDARPLAPLMWDQVVPSMARLQVEFLSVDPDWDVTPAGS